MPLVEQTIVQTFRLLYSFKKWNDIEALLTGAVNMVTGLRKVNEGKAVEGGKTGAAAANAQPVANLPLEFCITTCMGLQAIHNFAQSRLTKLTAKERADHLETSFSWAQQMLSQFVQAGFKEDHIGLLLEYSQLVLEDVKTQEVTDIESVE